MNLKEIKQRIQSVKSTQKITSAMKLISSAKLRRAQSAIENMRPYEQKMNEILSSFLLGSRASFAEYTAARETKRVAVIAVSSHSGLCGGFNAGILRQARGHIDKYIASGVEVEIYPVGKKIADAMQKAGFQLNTALKEQAAAVSYDEVSIVATELIKRFLAGEIDRVDLIYTRFLSAAKQEPVTQPLLPLSLDEEENHGLLENNDFIIEPSEAVLLQQLLPKVVVLRLYTALLDSAAAEHAARMLAMQVATDNADDLIADLVLEYNKGRQQAITNELLDIVAGSTN